MTVTTIWTQFIPRDIADCACTVEAIRELTDNPYWLPQDVVDLIRESGGLKTCYNPFLEEAYADGLQCWPPPFSMFACRAGFYLLEATQPGGYRSRLLSPDEKLAVTTWHGDEKSHMQCVLVRDWPAYRNSATYLITRKRNARRK